MHLTMKWTIHKYEGFISDRSFVFVFLTLAHVYTRVGVDSISLNLSGRQHDSNCWHFVPECCCSVCVCVFVRASVICHFVPVNKQISSVLLSDLNVTHLIKLSGTEKNNNLNIV